METHRLFLFTTAVVVFGVVGCCKEGEDTPAAAVPVPVAPATTPTSTVTAKRTYWDAGVVYAPEAGSTFGGPPPIVTGKHTASQPATTPPSDTRTFGGPPSIATTKKTGTADTTKAPTLGAPNLK